MCLTCLLASLVDQFHLYQGDRLERELHSVRNELAVTNSNLNMMMAQLESRNVALDKLFEDRKDFDRKRDNLIDSSFEQQAKQLHEHTERLNRHRINIGNHSNAIDMLKGRSEEIRGRHEDLVTRVDDMAGQLYHCARSVPISSVSDHSGLEYLSEGSYHIPPQEPCSHCSSNHVVPEENDIPLPIPAPFTGGEGAFTQWVHGEF